MLTVAISSKNRMAREGGRAQGRDDMLSNGVATPWPGYAKDERRRWMRRFGIKRGPEQQSGRCSGEA